MNIKKECVLSSKTFEVLCYVEDVESTTPIKA